MTNNLTSFPFIVTDIGGTNARFGLVTGEKDSNQRFIVDAQITYICRNYNKFEDVFSEYLDTVKHKSPKHACIAIAAPVTGDEVEMTNLSWSFSINTLTQLNNLDSIRVINDFGALAYSTLYLQSDELQTLYKGHQHADGTLHSRAIIGPGTGLGIAGLINNGATWQPVCGEGGHISFAPLNAHQVALRNALQSILNSQHISIENLLSGPGLENIYNAICHINGQESQKLTATEISDHARNGADKNSVETLQQFTQILGASVGDIALTMGAFGGVYLSGGILPKIVDVIDIELLIQSYLNKGIKQELVKTVPIHLVLAPMPALIGAAHWMNDQVN